MRKCVSSNQHHISLSLSPPTISKITDRCGMDQMNKSLKPEKDDEENSQNAKNSNWVIACLTTANFLYFNKRHLTVFQRDIVSLDRFPSLFYHFEQFTSLLSFLHSSPQKSFLPFFPSSFLLSSIVHQFASWAPSQSFHTVKGICMSLYETITICRLQVGAHEMHENKKKLKRKHAKAYHTRPSLTCRKTGIIHVLLHDQAHE